MSDDGSITEGAENGKLIYVRLTGMKFADTLTASNWKLTNLPEGVTQGDVKRVSDTEATITLSGYSLADYDSDLTDLKLECAAAEVKGQQAPLTCTGGVAFKALDDPESIAVTWAAAPGTNGAEATMNADALVVTLTGGTFVKSNINDIKLSGTAVWDAHITKRSVTWISSKELRLDLAWDGTDYDEDKTLTVSIPVIAYADSKGGTVLTKDITCTATVEQADQTSDMDLALTEPLAGGDNSISVGGGIRSGEVNVVNGTGLVVLTGAKTTAQKVEVNGTDKDAVTAGGTATAPSFAVDTLDIAAAGGTKTFILTVSEEGKSSIAYTITVKVAAKAPAVPLAKLSDVNLSAEGIVFWTDLNNETGYSVQLYKDGTASGTEVLLSADNVSHNFSEAMKTGGAGVYTVKAKAIGDGAVYLDGPWSEVSNGIIQLAAVSGGLVWIGYAAHWEEVADADSYNVYLYRDDNSLQTLNILSDKASLGADFSEYITSEGTYTFKVIAKGDGTTKADAGISPVSEKLVKDSRTDQQKLDADLALFEIPLGTNTAADKIRNSITPLPLTLPNGTTVVWTSSNTSVMDNDGKIPKRPAADTIITMTAALENGSATATRTFELNVRKSRSSVGSVSDLRVLQSSGIAKWGDLRYETGYRVRLYKDSVLVETRDVAKDVVTVDFKEDMLKHGPGKYGVSVQGFGDYATYEDGAESDIRPSMLITQLAPPSNAHWQNGIAYWDKVEGATSYFVRLYRDTLDRNTATLSAEDLAKGVDFTEDIETGYGGIYTFRVVANGNDLDIAASGYAVSDGIEKMPTTADMHLELTSPEPNMYNTIDVGSVVKVGKISVVYGTTSVTVTGRKGLIDKEPSVQTVKAGGAHAGAVSITGGETKNPVFTIDTSDISKGGSKAFTFIISEEGYSDVIYKITLTVAANRSVFSNNGVVQWEDVSYETGYRLQVICEGEKYGDPIIVDADTTSYDLSKIMDELSVLKNASGDTISSWVHVNVTALGDGTLYPDGPETESNTVTQLAAIQLAYFENGKLVLTRAKASHKYSIKLYKADKATPEVKVLVKTKEAYSNGNNMSVTVDLTDDLKAAGEGIYYATITAIQGNSAFPERASTSCEATNSYEYPEAAGAQ